MPGKKWSDEELQQLQALRRAGMPTAAIFDDPELLPGKSLDAIRQQLRRKGWVDQDASERARKAALVEFTPQQHRMFVHYLHRYGKSQPIELLVQVWNTEAKERSVPVVSESMVYYWLGKLRIAHSRKDAWDSVYCRRKRKAAKERRFEERAQELQMRASLELERMREAAREYRRSHPEAESRSCGRCGRRWPLDSGYFHRFTGCFIRGGGKLHGFQTEICVFCSTTINREVALLRSYGRDCTKLLDEKKNARRRALDKVFRAELAAAKETSQRLFSKKPDTPGRVCIRCRVKWPLDVEHFHHNRNGSGTLRELCIFCDHEYLRLIDRAKADKRDPSFLIEERSAYIVQARERARRERRIAARRRRQKLLQTFPAVPLKRCSACSEKWPSSLDCARGYWTVRHYDAAGGETKWYLSGQCLFCMSEQSAAH